MAAKELASEPPRGFCVNCMTPRKARGLGLCPACHGKHRGAVYKAMATRRRKYQTMWDYCRYCSKFLRGRGLSVCASCHKRKDRAWTEWDTYCYRCFMNKRAPKSKLCYSCDPRLVEDLRQQFLRKRKKEKRREELAKQALELLPLVKDSLLEKANRGLLPPKGPGSALFFRCRSCGKVFKRALQRVVASSLCDTCGGKGRERGSRSEGECAAFVASLVPVVRHDRTVLSPRELDIYCPTVGVAVEYNGDYFHSEAFFAKSQKGFESAEVYHLWKLAVAEAAGVKLAFVWESDWRARRGEVEAALRCFVESRGEVKAPLLSQLSSPLPRFGSPS